MNHNGAIVAGASYAPFTTDERRHAMEAKGANGIGPRFAVFVDLENLIYGWGDPGCNAEGGAAMLAAAVHDLACRGRVVAGVAVCNRRLARDLAFTLAELGLRVFPHRGGADRADRELLGRLERQLPASCDTVVIVSGDHAFAPAARRLRAAGIRVEVWARPRSLSGELRAAAHETRVLVDAGTALEALAGAESRN